MKNFSLIAFFGLLFFNPFILCAQNNINEDDLFMNQDLIVEPEKDRGEIKQEEEKKTIGFSSEVIGVSDFLLSRNKAISNNMTSSYILGKFFLDARLKRGTKYFGNLEVQNNAQNNNTEISAKESFIDFNVKDKAYFRVGKQLLQWGRAYLWNPSDLINVEKKPFIKKIGSLEGTYGLKLHIPFGTRYNIYGFVDSHNVQNPRDLGLALKYEFVFRKTEMAFSVWNKRKFNPVYAYDLSSRIFGVDTIIEAAVSHGDNNPKIRLENGIPVLFKEEKKWIPRVTLDFGRQFDFMNINDRISVNAEFYYNHNGYTENILENEITRGFLFQNNLYEPNYLSKYYAALFTSFNRFIITDLSLAVNYIRNIVDRSDLVLVGLTYRDTINDFSLGLNTYTFIGKENREYTLSNNTHTFQLTVGVLF